MPDPELQEDDVLVQIHAAGVDVLDSKIETANSNSFCAIACRSSWAMTWPGSWSGSDSRVRRFKPGDEVYARPTDGRIGAFAEFIAIKGADVAIKPKALTMEEAAPSPWSA